MVAAAGIGATVLQYVSLALQYGPTIIQAGMKLEALAEQVIRVVRSDTGPTNEDFDQLAEQRRAALATLEAAATPEPPVI